MIRHLPLLFALLVTGCAGVATQPVDNPEAAWLRHQQSVESVDVWRLTGRLSVRNDGENWHATLDWRQQAGDYQVNIVAPFGQGSVRLEGGPRQVVLRTSEGRTATSAEPDRLLYEQLGWRVPVDSLRYWVLGLPAPGAASLRDLDAQGRLSRLLQSGWVIRFMDYRTVDGVELPGRVFASRAEAEVRLVVGEWRLSGPTGA